jgi:hypothetical protein
LEAKVSQANDIGQILTAKTVILRDIQEDSIWLYRWSRHESSDLELLLVLDSENHVLLAESFFAPGGIAMAAINPSFRDAIPFDKANERVLSDFAHAEALTILFESRDWRRNADGTAHVLILSDADSKREEDMV